MQFKLSTVLLLILSIALLTGWLTDRSIQRNSEETVVDREGTAARIYFRLQEALNELDPQIAKGDSDNEIVLVRALIDLCQNETLFDNSSYSFSYDAITRARIILRRLECNSAESFRQFAVSLYPFMPETEQVAYREENNISYVGFIDPPNEKHHPELYDPNSDEYGQLDEFLSRALEPVAQEG